MNELCEDMVLCKYYLLFLGWELGRSQLKKMKKSSGRESWDWDAGKPTG